MNTALLSPETAVQTLQLLRELARYFGILPPHPQPPSSPEYPVPNVTFTIGTSARDYSTIASWEADWDTGLYTAGDTAVGELYDDSAFDEAVTFNGGGTSGLAAALLTSPVGERHTGMAGTGARIVRASAGGTIINLSAPMPVTVEWLEINMNGQAGTNNAGVVHVPNADPGRTQNNRFGQLIIHGMTNTGGNAAFATFPSTVTQMYDCILYNATQTNAGSATLTGVLINGAASGRTPRLFNTTIYKITRNTGSGNATGVLLVDSSGVHCRNVLVCDVDGTSIGTLADFSPSSFSSATVDHNLSSDTTASGTGSLTSKTAANQFVSVVGGSEDLRLKTGADAINAGTDLGTTPTGVNFDIDNRDRDAQGDVWDIGADEFVAAAAVGFGFILSGVGGGAGAMLLGGGC